MIELLHRVFKEFKSQKECLICGERVLQCGQRVTLPNLVLQVDALRVRLEEKETFLTKKTKQLQDLSDEKSTLTGESRDLKDMLEVKERKVNVLQKKVRTLAGEGPNLWFLTSPGLTNICPSSRSRTSWSS